MADVFRFFNPATGSHYFAVGDTARAEIAAANPTWLNEGVAFQALTSQIAGTTPVMRLYNADTGRYLFTSNAAEIEIVQTQGFVIQDTAAWYVSATEGGATGYDLSVVRIYVPALNSHVYSSNQAEIDILINQLNGVNEGAAYFISSTGVDDGAKTDPDSGINYGDSDEKVGTTTIELAYEPTELEGMTAQSSDQINLTAFRSDSRFAGIDGTGQTVVVIDTGIDLDHSAFGPDTNGDGVSDRIVYHQDFSQDGDGTVNDVDGHGSHVASIVASSASGYTGMAPNANIIALQGLGNNGGGSFGDVEKALQWVVRNASAYNITAVNMSLGATTNRNTEAANPYGLDDELAALTNLGVITIVAAGNDYAQFQTEGTSNLSADPNSIAVGAVWSGDFGKVGLDNTTAADRITNFSQRSDDIPSVMAPGALITGAAPGGGTVQLQGTSMAAPHIAGIAALAQQLANQTIGRSLSPAEFESLLLQTGVTVFDGDDEDNSLAATNTNYQRVDVLALGEAILSLGGGTTPTPNPTDTIPNDTSTTAAVTIGTDLGSSIDFSGDSDWIRASLTAGQTYTIDILGSPSSAGTLSDPTLTLRDSLGNVITYNDDGGTGYESRLEYTPTSSGTYYLDVAAYGSATGSYVVRTSSTGGSTDIAGDTSTTATITAGSTVTGTLDFAVDRDWYQIQLTAGGIYQIDLKGAPSGAGTIADPYVRLYNSSGQLVDYNDDGGTGLESLLQYTPSTTGTYYISAGSFRNTDLGTYSLSVSQTGQSTQDIPGDSSTTSVITGTTSVNTSTLESAGDTDWFRLDVTAGSSYQIDLEGTGSSALSDPLVRVVTAAGTELARNDDGGTGLNSQLIYSPTTTGTVYISAEAYGNYYSGDYQLTVVQTSVGGADIPDDTSTTQTVTLNSAMQSDLGFVGDEDWFAWDIVAGTSYQVSLAGVGSNELSDPLLRIYDSTGTSVLLSNDDGGTGLDSLLNVTATSSGRVYIEADSYGGFYTGDYQLLVTVTGTSALSGARLADDAGVQVLAATEVLDPFAGM
ncbi:S8 family serine peptidase [Labrenzia sp. PHM005]|uniref:S8 family serine peptidase n=1 Tax=Labrenzia sp. PHM005 TaxID=2590016 RepID=UPI00113FD67C|nr:S8 family serine peptidase [Labrenzia sp. PHM005]QDG76103.1 hypothetical protein FJ695_09615 [Labrenzia sp. PHM005]